MTLNVLIGNGSWYSVAGNGTLAGIEVQVAPVVSSVQGTFVTLSSFTQLSSWVDGSYTQDFWRAGNTIDDMTFVVTRERGTDRVEVWGYKPPAVALRPLDGSPWTPPTTPQIEDDKTYDVKISVNSALITPQYSSGTTTRMLFAPGTIRRLCSAFKPWSWAAVDTAIAAYRLAGHDNNSAAFFTLVPTVANMGISAAASATFDHGALGGTSSTLWFDGVRSAQGGDDISSRSVYHSWEGFAISDRKNSVTANLSALESALRKAAEYAGSFPQYAYLNPSTLRPYDPQQGANQRTTEPFGFSSNTVRGAYWCQQRNSYNWGCSHHYNNGHVAFEATKDPFYALTQQINGFAAISQGIMNESQRTAEAKLVDPAIVGSDPYWVATAANVPFYLYYTFQVRGRFWTAKEIAKCHAIATQCSAVDFLNPVSTFTSVNSDAVTQFNAFAAQIDAATFPTQITNESESTQATRAALKALSCYMNFYSESEDGSPSKPKAKYVSTFMNEYAAQSLAYIMSYGLTNWQTVAEKVIGYTINKALYLGGARTVLGFGDRGSSTMICQLASTDGLVQYPVAFTTPSGYDSSWASLDSTYAAKSKTNFGSLFNYTGNTTSSNPNYSASHVIVLKIFKQLNDAGRISVRVSDVNSAWTATQAQVAATSATIASYYYSGRLLSWA